MRVVHVPFGYYPDPVGGTEVYVAGLVNGLRHHGIDSVVAAPALGADARAYSHGGAAVYRFAVGPVRDVADLYGEGDATAATAIDRVLGETRADVLHLHAFTSAGSLRALRAARRRGVAVAFTYHTPTASCVRGTLLRDGHVPCDGELLEHRCASCLLESRGAGDAVRAVLSRAPTAIGSTVAASGATGSWVTALRARELTRARHNAFRRLLREADAVIAVCEWARSLLIRAGAEPSRIVLSRQGTPAIARAPVAANAAGMPDAFRLAFVGRLHPTKGVHVAVKALLAKPHVRATLDVYGVAQDDEAQRYLRDVQALAAGDPRVRFLTPVPSAAIVVTLAAYHATVVPSQWLETGPLTVLESFAAGVPVLGSDLGGVAELVTHGRDGWLVPYSNVAAWSSAVERFANDRTLVAQLAKGVRPPRTMDDVAADMASVYRTIVAHPRAAEQVDRGRHASAAALGVL